MHIFDSQLVDIQKHEVSQLFLFGAELIDQQSLPMILLSLSLRIKFLLKDIFVIMTCRQLKSFKILKNNLNKIPHELDNLDKDYILFVYN